MKFFFILHLTHKSTPEKPAHYFGFVFQTRVWMYGMSIKLNKCFYFSFTTRKKKPEFLRVAHAYLRVARRVFTSKNAIDNTRFYAYLRVFI